MFYVLRERALRADRLSLSLANGLFFAGGGRVDEYVGNICLGYAMSNQSTPEVKVNASHTDSTKIEGQ
jgi:thiamine pyrophosphokinase